MRRKTEWYVSIDGNVRGPYLLEQIANMYKSGNIAASAKLCPKGEDNWYSVHQILRARKMGKIERSIGLVAIGVLAFTAFLFFLSVWHQENETEKFSFPEAEDATIIQPAILPEINYADILLTPENHLGKSVTMRGQFGQKYAERNSFDLVQGDETIEVFYEDLPREDQNTIRSQRNFSETSVVVEGKLKRYSNAKSSYYIVATGVKGLKLKLISYIDVLLSPEEYIGNHVVMRGGFAFKDTDSNSFHLAQGDETIEVFYEDLPRVEQRIILSQRNFSNVPMMACGWLERFRDGRNSYYIRATEVLWE